MNRPRTISTYQAAVAVASTVAALLLVASPSARADEPQQIEVNVEKAVLTFLDGTREQREVERGRRFTVVRRLDAYYVVQEGNRQAMIAISNVIPANKPAARPKWEYVVTTAAASVAVKHGRRSIPNTVQQGEVFEVLGPHPLGSTLYILLDNGRTAEVSSKLVRPAKPSERPKPPAVGRVPGPVPLGCEISVDLERNVFVEYIYLDSLAQRIGLQPGTRILEVNGEEIHSAADYDRASQQLGGNLRILVRRFGLDYPEMIEYRDPRNRR